MHKISLPQFLWGKFFTQDGSDPGYQLIAGTEGIDKSIFEALSPGAGLIGETSRYSDVDIYALSKENNKFIWSWYHYDDNFWKATRIPRQYFVSYHIVIDAEFLDAIRYNLDCLRVLKNFPYLNQNISEYKNLQFLELTWPEDGEKLSAVEQSLITLTKKDGVGLIIRKSLDGILAKKRVSIVNFTGSTEDKMLILNTLACIIPSTMLDCLSFSTHTFLRADKDIVRLRFYGPDFPVAISDGLVLNYQEIEEEVMQ